MGAASSNNLKGLLDKDVVVRLKSDTTATGNPDTTLQGHLVGLQGNNIVVKMDDATDKAITLSLSNYKTDLAAPGAATAAPMAEKPIPPMEPEPAPLVGGNRRSKRKHMKKAREARKDRKAHHRKTVRA
jgi:hypothetical protein